MSSLTNFVLSNTSVTAALNTNEIEADYGDIVSCDVHVQALTGAPTTASLTIAFQVGPIEYKGYNMNWEPSGDLVPWQTVVAADGYLGQLLLDGAWPTTLDQTKTYPILVNRRLLVPPMGRLVRVVLTPTFSGGTTPGFTCSVVMAVSGK